MKSFKQAPLIDRVSMELQTRILDGRLSPGTPVRQDILAAEFGISKIPLREAMVRLVQDGLLLYEQNRGYFVKEMNLAEAEEVFALRRAIEPEAAGRACTNASKAEREFVIEAYSDLERSSECSPGEIGELNARFHVAMIGNHSPITVQILKKLHFICERYVFLHLTPQGRDLRAVDEHREIFAAWLAGHAEEVIHQSQIHIDGTIKDLRNQLVGSV